MGILSDINKTINDADMYIWYNHEYIPFVLNHIEDVINATTKSSGFKYGGMYMTYAVYLPEVCIPQNLNSDICKQWLHDNYKIIHGTDDNLYYTDDFLKDSNFMVHQFNHYWSKVAMSADNYSKNSYYVDYSEIERPAVLPERFTMKANYASNVKDSFVYNLFK